MKSSSIGSSTMDVSEMLNQAMLVKGVRKKDIAAKMGWSSQNFSNRLKNKTIDAEEWIKLAGLLGYEIQMVDMESKVALKPRKESSGPRVVQIVEGISFDTEKATSLCRSPKVYGGWFELFQDFATRQFFTVAYFETGESACLARIAKENAERFYLDCGGEEASDYFA